MGEQNELKGPKDGGTSAPGPRPAPPPQETESDRRKAKRRHFTHYRNQVLSWAVVIVLTAASYHVEDWYRVDFVAAVVRPSPPLWIVIGYYVGLLVPPVGFLCIFSVLGFFVHFLQMQNWAVAIGNAQQTISPRNVTKGYTDMFNIYMRTKRRGYLLAGWGLLAFVYVFMGTVMNFSVSTPPLYWVSQFAVAALGVALIWLGYVMGCRYLPGDVIVRHTLALSIFAISDVTNVEEARLQAEKDAAQFVHENPWWFYPG